MSFLDRAKQAAEQARRAAADAASSARQVAIETGGRAQATMRDPATQAKARLSLRLARKGIATAVERIDPAVLADVVIKATSLQERANAALRAKGSPYRISEIAIGAAIPPSITFSIARLDDPAADPTDHPTAGTAQVTATDAETITTLDGTELVADDLVELADGS